jgi:FG-GAP repeat
MRAKRWIGGVCCRHPHFATMQSVWLGVLIASGHSIAFAQCIEQQKLTASDAGADDWFGASVSVSGETALVGTYRDDCVAGADCGSAYVFRFNGTTWLEEQKLTASDADAGDWFGFTVAISNNTAVVGAYRDDCAAGADCGSVYVFRFDGATWSEEQRLTASDSETNDWFGHSVSVGGDRVLVGGPKDDCAGGANCGAAYVFQFNGTMWVEEQKLAASNSGASDRFGFSVSVSGSTAVIGAWASNCPMGDECGSAYVFRFDGNSWTEEQTLNASDADDGDNFGVSVSVSGVVVVVGADRNDGVVGSDSGTAYVFRFDGVSWIEEQKLMASDATAGDFFGFAVAVGGDTTVIGAWGDDCATGTFCGSAYTFRFNGVGWNEDSKISSSDIADGDAIGRSVSVSGDMALTSAAFDDCLEGTDCGSAYMFACVPQSACTEEQKLTASDAADSDQFGRSVSVHGNAAVVGSWLDDHCGPGTCGSAYAFRFDGVSWIQEDKLVASDAAPGDQFGVSVALEGDVAVVGAYLKACAAGNSCGSAYVFRFNGLNWVEEQILTASDEAALDNFGFSVSLNGVTAVVGAPNDDCAAGVDCGSAYVFRSDGVTWVQQGKLTASDAAMNDDFGRSVSVSGNKILVGANLDDCATGIDCGSAYVFRFDGVNWIEEQKLAAADAASLDLFGYSVSIDGDTVIAGAYTDDCTAGFKCGSAYVFGFNGSTWVEEQRLTGSATGDDRFGFSVALRGDTAGIGAIGDECLLGGVCGAVYIYRFFGSYWVQQQKLVGFDTEDNDVFGVSVSLSDHTVVIGAQADECPVGGASCGAAYTFACVQDLSFACCIPDESCQIATEATCNSMGGAFHPGIAECGQADCESIAIPTMSEWGTAVMSLLLLAAGTTMFRKRGLLGASRG